MLRTKSNLKSKPLSIKTPDGLLLEAFQWGDLETAETLYFCHHGLATHALWFEKLASFLTDTHHCVIAVDRRGSGGSEGTRMFAKNLDELLDDIDAWLESFHFNGEIVAIGHCWGAMLVEKWIALRGKKMVSKAILIAPPYKTIFTNHWHGFVLKLVRNLFGKTSLPLPYGADIFSDDPAIVQQIENDPLLQRKSTISLLSLVYQTKSITELSNHFTIILGSHDKLVLLDDIQFHDARVITFQEAGHGMVLEIPDLIASKILN